MRLNFFQWFENLKTQAKLLTVFGLVGVTIAAMAGVGIVTNGRLSTQAETVYVDYTVPLTEFNQLLFNVNRYHEALVDVARTPRASDFEIELKDIAPYRAEIERLISGYEKTTLRTSSTGRDETKDLAELKAALTEFFAQGDAAINTIKESFENKALSSGQALAMRELGALAITVSLSPAFEKVTQRHAEQIKTMSEVAKDLSDEAKTMASNATWILVVGRVAAGLPLLAQENIEDMIQLPKEWAPSGAFLLKVQGNSMEGAHILDGDYVLVHPQKTAANGEIVVALIGDEATVKRFYRTERGVTLKAENPKYEPIEIERSEATAFSIVGKVMGVLRVMKK